MDGRDKPGHDAESDEQRHEANASTDPHRRSAAEPVVSFYVVQFITGLASACSLFLVASGLSIIFGVTRIVNFAHGAFYMLGAYVAYSAIEKLGPAHRLLAGGAHRLRRRRA